MSERLIYYYCNLQTAVSVLKNKELWMTSIRNLNDSNESIAVYKLFFNLLEEYDQHKKLSSMLEYAKTAGAIQMYTRPLGAYPEYISCFSKNPDSVSQWIAYADNGQGIAIGFDEAELEKLAEKNGLKYQGITWNSLLAAFESFHDRVWIPYQVAYEYMRKRCEVIYETVQRYDQFKKEIDSFTNKAVETLRLTSNDEEISDLKRYLFKWLDSNKDRNLLVLSAEEDEILDKILVIFDHRVGLPPSDEELFAIKEEGKERYKKSIPPGYKDDKKKNGSEDDNNAYGDLIIWKQIIKYAKDNQVGIIYVTHDQKEDWWNIVKGKTIGPRFELRKEFQTETQQEFHMYSMNSFISTYNKMNEVPIDKSAVQEVISLDKAYSSRGTRSKKEFTVSERIARTEETIEKIQNRIIRRERIIEDIENKYLQKGFALPENIQAQYDNTQDKASELRAVLEEKKRELELLKQSQLPLDGI